MGLLIGGSAITICELLDLVILNSILKYVWRRKSTSKVSVAHQPDKEEEEPQKKANKSQVVNKYECTPQA